MHDVYSLLIRKDINQWMDCQREKIQNPKAGLNIDVIGKIRLELGEKGYPFKESVRLYRKFVYETGAIPLGDKPYTRTIDEKVVEKERKKNYEITHRDRFLYRTRHFTDSGIIGSREFVAGTYRQFRH
jgi:hypothetical protein